MTDDDETDDNVPHTFESIAAVMSRLITGVLNDMELQEEYAYTRLMDVRRRISLLRKLQDEAKRLSKESAMIRKWILDYDRNPIEIDDAAAWEAWNFVEKNRRVAWTDIAWGRFVSTLFIGIDMSHGKSKRPILFETAIYSTEELGWEVIERYASWKEALAGHERAVRASGGEEL